MVSIGRFISSTANNPVHLSMLRKEMTLKYLFKTTYLLTPQFIGTVSDVYKRLLKS